MSSVVCSTSGCSCVEFRAHAWMASKCADCAHTQVDHEANAVTQPSALAPTPHHTAHVASKSSAPPLAAMFRPPPSLNKRASAPTSATAGSVLFAAANATHQTRQADCDDDLSVAPAPTSPGATIQSEAVPESQPSGESGTTSMLSEPRTAATAATSPPRDRSVSAASSSSSAASVASPPSRQFRRPISHRSSVETNGDSSSLAAGVMHHFSPLQVVNEKEDGGAHHDNDVAAGLLTGVALAHATSSSSSSRLERSASHALPSSGPPNRPPPPIRAVATSYATAPSALPSHPTAAAASNSGGPSDLQRRFEVEFNKRTALEAQVAAIMLQITAERKQRAATLEDLQMRLDISEKTVLAQQQTASDQAAQVLRLRQEIADLSGERAMLSSQVLGLQEQLEELEETPPPPPAPPAAPTNDTAGPSLEARCAHFERLWRKERTEREMLEVRLEARDIHDQHRRGSISAFDVNTGATIVDRRPRHGGGGLHPVLEQEAFDEPPPPPPPAPAASPPPGEPYTNHRASRRVIPEDLEGFDTDATLRIKPGTSFLMQHGFQSFEKEDEDSPPSVEAATMHAPVPIKTDAMQQNLSPPPPLPAQTFGVRSVSAGTKAKLSAAAKAAAEAASCVEIHELDAAKIVSLLSARYAWQHDAQRAYFRHEVDDILEDAHDPDVVREALRQLELQQVRPLKYELVALIGAGGFGSVYKAVRKEDAIAAASTSDEIKPSLSRPSSTGSVGGEVPKPGLLTRALSLGSTAAALIDPPKLVRSLSTGSTTSTASSSETDPPPFVAIKVLDLEDTVDFTLITREIAAISNALSCEQLTHYYESFVLGTKLWLVMEYVDGGSVLDFISKQRAARARTARNFGQLCGVDCGLEEKHIAVIVREVLQGLAFLASQNQVHRDIKCANILISRSTGAVKLADFGTARQLTDTMTKCNTFTGSPYWMAPEILRQADYDGKADIWSLGVSCLEMAHGAPPHSGLHPLQVMTQIASSPPPVLEGDFSRAFKDFVALCCIKDPTRRPHVHTLLKHPFVKKSEVFGGALAKKPTTLIKEMFASSK